jgi:Flp pilus assembly protein TadG
MMIRRPKLFSLHRDDRGVAAVEFALVAPILMLILAGAVDLGGVLYAKFQLDCAVNAATNYAMSNAASVNSTSGASLASTMAALVANAEGSASANTSITINSGPTASVTGSTTTTGGTAGNANACYCPSGSSASVTWGSSATCGAACSSGGYAGKWVVVQASVNYTPIFSNYGIVSSGQITSSAITRVQ